MYQLGDTSDYAEFYVSDERVNYHCAHGTGHKFFTDHGYIDIGPMNDSGAHIYTDTSQFFMNKRLTLGVTSGEAIVQGYGDQNLEIRRAQGTADRIESNEWINARTRSASGYFKPFSADTANGVTA